MSSSAGEKLPPEPSTRPFMVQLAPNVNGDDTKPSAVTTLLHHPETVPNSMWTTVDGNAGQKVSIRGRLKWFVVWKKFAEYTTLHGFRQIAEQTDYLSRRILWVFLTTFAFGLLLYQMGNSVQLYLSRPVAFNVKRNYYTKLSFPAITICNQNVFRITQAWNERLYDFLEQMYDVKSTNNSEFIGLDEPLTKILDKMKHRKEDLFLSCTWNRVSNCNKSELVKNVVDNSVCYTFNGDHDNEKVTSLTGSDTGLNVLLNIEQYEFMRTRSLTAGIQVYVHHQGDLPRESISVPPGMKAYIRVSTQHVKLLSHPYGVCDQRPLKYYTRYSTSMCLIECREDWLMDKCSCHSGALPINQNVSKGVCSLRNYSSCILPRLAEYTPAIGKCECPTNCNFRRYNSFISFSQISTFDVDQALRRLPSGTLNRLIKAREVFYQVNEDKRRQTVDRTLVPFVNITNIVHNNLVSVHNKVKSLKQEVKALESDLRLRFNFHDYMLQRMVYAVKNNWCRGWSVAKERTLILVANDYLPLLASLELFEETYRNNSYTEEQLNNYRTILDTRLYEKIKMAERALSNLTEIHDSFVNTTLLLTYKITKERYYDHDFAPKSIITKKSKYEKKFMRRYIGFTKQLRDIFILMRRQIQGSDAVKQPINETEFHKLKRGINRLSKRYNYYMFLYEDRIVNGASKSMENVMNAFKKENESLVSNFFKVDYSLNNLQSILNNLEKQYHKSGSKVVDIAANYINQSSSLEYNLTALSSYIVAGPAGKYLESFVSGLDTIDVYRVTLEQDIWVLRRTLARTVNKIWDQSLVRPYSRLAKDVVTLCRLNATTSKDITKEQLTALGLGPPSVVNVTSINKMRLSAFDMASNSKGNVACDGVLGLTNSDWQLEGKKSVIRRLTNRVGALSQVAKLIANVTSFKEELLLQVVRMKAFSAEFLRGNEISHKFVRDNFVELQIYFQDLVSVDESQSPAYTMTQLWSDFGGNFGLLLGASVLSVIEIVDFLIHESIKIKR